MLLNCAVIFVLKKSATIVLNLWWLATKPWDLKRYCTIPLSYNSEK